MIEPTSPPPSQLAPCDILCAACPLGSGEAADSAGQTRKHITDCLIPACSPFTPGGEAIDWAAVDRALDWMTTYARCAGCRNGGGPPDWAIRICAHQRGYELCSSCADLEGCTRFEWLGEHGADVREKLMQNRELLPEEHVLNMRSA